MISVVQKWRVTVTVAGGKTVDFAISDHHEQNVLRTLAGLDFGRAVEVHLVKERADVEPPRTTGIYTSGSYQT